MKAPDLGFSGKQMDYPDIPITNGEKFWPDLNVGEFKRSRSLPPSIPDETLGHALLATMAELNQVLATVAEHWKARSITTANDAPGGKMGDESQLTAQYKKAVYARAKADLIGEFAIVGRRDSHPTQGSDETPQRLLAEASNVIRNMLNLPRVGVYSL